MCRFGPPSFVGFDKDISLQISNDVMEFSTVSCSACGHATIILIVARWPSHSTRSVLHNTYAHMPAHDELFYLRAPGMSFCSIVLTMQR